MNQEFIEGSDILAIMKEFMTERINLPSINNNN